MKQINVYFEDDEHKKIAEAKGNLSWHDFIIQLSEKKEDSTTMTKEV